MAGAPSLRIASALIAARSFAFARWPGLAGPSTTCDAEAGKAPSGRADPDRYTLNPKDSGYTRAGMAGGGAQEQKQYPDSEADRVSKDKGPSVEHLDRTQRAIFVIPGLDPGTAADSIGWGDPRISSGDGEEEKSRLRSHPDPDTHGATLRHDTGAKRMPVRRPLLVLSMLLALGATAQAQTSAEKRAQTDRLLDALKAAPDERVAAGLESQLEQTWLRAGSPAVTLLISRGLRSLQSGQDDEAMNSFSDAITLQPDVAEAWHQRALARYHAGDVNGAIRDLQETIQLEPGNFSAFRTLTEIATAREDWKGAYGAWQKVMELDPKTAGGEERLRLLKRRAVGEDT
jgi:tetratricopeptide (TPR) repeat protein